MAEDNNSKFNLSTTAFLMAGVSLIWIGIYQFDIIFGTLSLDVGTYNVVKILLSAFVMISALDSFRNGMMTEGLFLMYMGLSSLSFSIGSLFFNVDGLILMDLLFAGTMIIVSIIFFLNGKKILSTAVIVLAVVMAYPNFTTYEINTVTCIGMLFSGLLFVYYGWKTLVKLEINKKNGLSFDIKSEVSDHSELSYELMVIPGMFTMGLFGVLNGIAEYNVTFYVAAVCMSFAIMVFGMYGIVRGIVLEGLMMLMYSSTAITMSIMSVFGYDQYVLLNVLFAIVIFICGFAFIFRKEYILGVSSLIFGIIMIPSVMFEGNLCWCIGSILMAVFLLYYSISRWLFSATGKMIIPIWRL